MVVAERHENVRRQRLLQYQADHREMRRPDRAIYLKAAV